MTTTSLKLHQVQVFKDKDGHQDVVGLVRWAVQFERNALVSVAGVETLLDTSNIQDFTPVEQLTKEQVLAWAYSAQGGDAFVEVIRQYHENDLDQQEQRLGLVTYSAFPVDSPNQLETTIPQQVL
jgi:hypothetical protein